MHPTGAATALFGIGRSAKPIQTSFEGNKLLWSTKTSVLKRIAVNWKKNRRPDLTRLRDLGDYMRLEGFVPNIIYTFTM